MVILYVLAGLILLVTALLCLPVGVRISYRGNVLRAVLTYCRLPVFSLWPMGDKKEKRPKKTRKQKAAPPEQAKAEPKKKKESAKDKLANVTALLKSSRKGLGILRRHLVFSGVSIFILVAGDDAHQTAVSYGNMGGAVSVGLAVASELFQVRKTKIHIAPDFCATRSVYDISLRVSIRPVFLVAAFLHSIVSYIKYNKNESTSKKTKGGSNYEPNPSH